MKKHKSENVETSEEKRPVKTSVIILEIAILVTITVIIAVFFGAQSAKAEKLANEPTVYEYHSVRAEQTTRYTSGLTTAPQDSNAPSVSSPDIDVNVNYSENAQQNKISADTSGWTTSQILNKARDAVNKTKRYNGRLSVSHSEAFEANVTECTGGAIVKTLANIMIGWVAKPVTETLEFNNGKTVNSEGETVPILLPKKSDFTLSEQGLTSASVSVVNNEYVIKLGIVRESVGMYQVPTHNAASIGYLDVANYDISFLTVDSADITYKGSYLELHINADDYVTYAEYHIPLGVTGSGHRGSLSGALTFDGEQSEVWRLNW